MQDNMYVKDICVKPPDEILCTVGIMLLSGYHCLPSRRLYWRTDPNDQISKVANAIRRNRFIEITSVIQLAGNSTNDGSD